MTHPQQGELFGIITAAPIPDTLPAITEFSGSYRWASNFYASPIRYESILYPTVEHAFQAAKALDTDERKRIALLATPGEAKRAGRRLRLRDDWKSIKIDVMRELIDLKFSQPKFRALLLATGDRELIEGNTWGDRFWGQCPLGVGRNELGKLLMTKRESLRQQALKPTPSPSGSPAP